MKLFGNKKVMVIYTCDRSKIHRASYLENNMTYNYILGLREFMNNCEKDNGACPDTCEIKNLLRHYSGHGNIETG